MRAHVSLEGAVVLLAVARQQHRGADVTRPLHLGLARAPPVVSLEDEAPVADVLFDCRDIYDGVACVISRRWREEHAVKL